MLPALTTSSSYPYPSDTMTTSYRDTYGPSRSPSQRGELFEIRSKTLMDLRVQAIPTQARKLLYHAVCLVPLVLAYCQARPMVDLEI